MKIKLTKISEYLVDAKSIRVSALVRYWDDAELNGEQCSEDITTFPMQNGERWEPLINIDSGSIYNWPKDTTANVHFKVCDQCGIIIFSAVDVLFQDEGYVPDLLCPEGEGYGDYIIMKIDSDGIIKNWNPKLIQDIFYNAIED